VGGVAIAILVATPEAIGAVRAPLANRVQRSINIFLGLVLSTIGLTIPGMIAISYSAQQIFQRLREEGYRGGVTILRDY
jgi:Ca2+/H+ antiporter